MTTHAVSYFAEAAEIAAALDADAVERIVAGLVRLRDQGGRLFLLGVGGGAGHCSHAVNDFRKLCGIEAYSPVDNVSELTARTNDEGWDTVFAAWLKTSKAGERDAILIFSVGGGDAERNVSANLVAAIDYAKAIGMAVYGVVGRDSGHTARMGDAVVVVPTADSSRVTPHTEGFQAVVWHCMVSHPDLQQEETKWEGLAARESDSGK